MKKSPRSRENPPVGALRDELLPLTEQMTPRLPTAPCFPADRFPGDPQVVGHALPAEEADRRPPAQRRTFRFAREIPSISAPTRASTLRTPMLLSAFPCASRTPAAASAAAQGDVPGLCWSAIGAEVLPAEGAGLDLLQRLQRVGAVPAVKQVALAKNRPPKTHTKSAPGRPARRYRP